MLAETSEGADDVDGDEAECDKLSRLAMAADEAGRPAVDGAAAAAADGLLLMGLEADSTEAETEAGTKAEKADTCRGDGSEGEGPPSEERQWTGRRRRTRRRQRGGGGGGGGGGREEGHSRGRLDGGEGCGVLGLGGCQYHLLRVLAVVAVQQQLVGQCGERREGRHERAAGVAEGLRQAGNRRDRHGGSHSGAVREGS